MTAIQDYEISSEVTTNDEGSDFVTLAIAFADGGTLTETFAGYFDDPGPSAVEQASSYVCAFEEAEERRAETDRLGVHPLEIAFAPFGPEWEREQQEDRMGW